MAISGLSNHHQKFEMPAGIRASSMPVGMNSVRARGRYDFDTEFRKGERKLTAAVIIRHSKKMRTAISPLASSSSSSFAVTESSNRAEIYKKILEAARDKFTREISFQSKDKDISLARALLYIAAEDEAFLALHREMDFRSTLDERPETAPSIDGGGAHWDSVETMLLEGKNVDEWLAAIDALAKEVEAELVEREIGCHLVEVLDAVNKVLFEIRGFKRLPVLVDSKCSYLHSALSTGQSSAILLSVVYIEVCRRLNLTIVGSRVGEDFLIWPSTGNPEELFKVTCGHSLFGIVNGKCVDDPRSRASDITSNSLLGLDIATNRDIIGIALANLIRLYWKRASRTNHGLMLTSPLRSTMFNNGDSSCPLLRPRELRLAMMASERLLILQPHNWALRRDHGMMLYYTREYEAAVQELSICMAFAPEDEAQALEPFVEKLHLLQLETSWKSVGRLTTT
ncbi:uncharacterized protein LOC127250647 [Andrographis paniculata]|uniref:uncharacterized protein LOC127250647 n=1 Tax=Andrographis paniculata TaxID=175694 RepID=UPI0021E95D72|nr:uncharacterized protein LOC127250647 [Andrographis paniculata]